MDRFDDITFRTPFCTYYFDQLPVVEVGRGHSGRIHGGRGHRGHVFSGRGHSGPVEIKSKLFFMLP